MESNETLAKTEDFYFLKELNEEQYRSSLELKKPGPLNLIYREEEIKTDHIFINGDYFYNDKNGKKFFSLLFACLVLINHY